VRIYNLTIYRFIAALIIVFFHYGRDTILSQHVFFVGTINFFFVLSGFVLTLTYLIKDMSFSRYFRARVYRIAPVYWLALLVTLLLQTEPISKRAAVLSVFFLQSWFPPYPATLNGPGWYLSVMMFFYLIFPQILAYIKFKQLQPGKLLALSSVVWLFTQIILTNLLNSPFYKPYPSIPHDLIFYFPISHFSSFLLGIAGAYLYLDFREKDFPSYMIILGLILSFAGCFVVLNYGGWINRQIGFALPYSAGVASPLFLALILFSSFAEKRFSGEWLNNSVFNLLGQASYAVYIFQLPFQKFYLRYLSQLVNTRPELDFYYYLVFLIVFSIAINKFFETPVRCLLFEKF